MKKQNSKLKTKRSEKAFTFIEVLAAIAVLAVGLLSVVALSSKSYAAISLQKNKLIATNLVREEMEIIRNVRNENWLYNLRSDCDKDGTFTTCSNGQIYEDNIGEAHQDCDWRCGNERDVAPYQPTFVLDDKLKDLDYLGNAVVGGPANNCDTQGVSLFRDATTGLYKNTSTVNTTPFKRLVTIKRDKDVNGDGNPDNDIQVVVTVCWQERGRLAWVSAEEHLFNWVK